MKIVRFIGYSFLLLTVAFCACSRQKTAFTELNAPLHFNELRAVEMLLETDPTKAAESVEELMTAALYEPFTLMDSMELNLRTVQMQYKNHWLDEESPDLAPVVAFYDSLAVLYPTDDELCYLRANAYYYKGVEYAFANDDVEAFRHYLDALGVMRQFEAWDEHPYAKRFIALSYTRLSEILYSYGLYEKALEACRQASEHFETDADLAAMMRYEANIYQAEKDYDKALARFEQSEALAPLGVDAVELAFGAKLFELQQYDSAYSHLKKAFATGDHTMRVDAAAKLAEICRIKGLEDEELRYTRFYVESSMRESRRASKKMEIEYLYDEFDNLNAGDTTESRSNNSLLLVLLLLLLVLIGFMAFIIVRNRSRISHIENQISDIEEKHRRENADKDLEISQMAQELNDTRERLENVTNHTFEEAWEGFNESTIAMKIKGMMESADIMIKNVGLFPKLKLKEVDMIELVRTVNANFMDCSQRFLKDFPDLNSADFRQCCLALLGMNDAQMAVLEGVSYSGVNRRTKKILAAMQTENSLEQAILTYLRNNW